MPPSPSRRTAERRPGPASVSRAKPFNHKLTDWGSAAGLVPIAVRGPLVAGQAGGLLPFLRALRTDPGSVERVPSAPAARIAEPPVVLLRLPAAARAPDAAP